MTTPVPGGGYSAQTTTTSFNTLLQAWKTTLPDGASVTNEFHLTGDLKKQSGSRIFPVEYTYDPQGRMKTMKTWQSSNTPTNQWVYDAYRGFPLRKEVLNYPYSPIVESTNTYKPSGRLATRTDGRGIVATYDYNAAGDLEAVSYSDGVTPQRFYSYDRRGRQISGNSNGVVTETVLGEAGQVLSEKTGVRSVNYGYDSFLRRTNLSVTISGAEVYRVGYGYDLASRLSSVSDGTYGVSYGYLTNSPLVETVGFKQNSTVRMTATKQFDNLNRLKQISHGALWSYAYGYNNANQRTTVTWMDGKLLEFRV